MGKEGQGEGWKWGAEDACTGCTGVNYASREMSNCSPYRKIYNSARCGKHYVLGPFSSPPLAAPPGRSTTFNHPRVCLPTACPPSHTRAFPSPALASSSPPRARASRLSRFANKFAWRTAIVLTSKQLRKAASPKSIFLSSSIK